ncbi:hypothetical protein FACS189468_9350 [Spirochaetia bacterium]|nr:hypothetical protein FACS189468_9350 [Spirochaetia bacterium]
MNRKIACAAMAALVLGLLITACGGGASPSAVVKNFYAAAEKGDAKKLAGYCTPETGALLSALGEKFSEAATTNGKITDTKETIDGDTAQVEITFENGETQNIDLTKVDGKWLVTINK